MTIGDAAGIQVPVEVIEAVEGSTAEVPAAGEPPAGSTDEG